MFTVGCLAICGLWAFAPLDAWLEALAGLLHRSPVLALALFCTLYIVGAFLLVPVTPLCLAGGWLWGAGWGTVIVFVVGMIADILPFVAVRYLGIRLPTSLAGRTGQALRSLDHYAEVNGFVLVLLVRWFPIAPFNLMNFALGMSRARFRDYVWGTAIACAPTTALCAYAGSLAPGGQAPTGLASSTPVGLAIVSLGVLSVLGLSYGAKRMLDASASAVPAPLGGDA